jgi:hypothetical protein
MQMYCTFVLFVKQHFPGLPASETHCIFLESWVTSSLPFPWSFKHCNLPLVFVFQNHSASVYRSYTFWTVMWCKEISCLADIRPWRWRWYFPPKRRFTYGLRGAISQKMAI